LKVLDHNIIEATVVNLPTSCNTPLKIHRKAQRSLKISVAGRSPADRGLPAVSILPPPGLE
jgi:hypothetical protein